MIYEFSCTRCRRTSPTDPVWREGDRLRKCDACATRISEEYAAAAKALQEAKAAQTIKPTTPWAASRPDWQNGVAGKVRPEPSNRVQAAERQLAEWEKWKAEHPHEMRWMLNYAGERLAKGLRVSAKKIFEDAREQFPGVHFPNEFTALIGRLAIQVYPNLEGEGNIVVKRAAADLVVQP